MSCQETYSIFSIGELKLFLESVTVSSALALYRDYKACAYVHSTYVVAER